MVAPAPQAQQAVVIQGQEPLTASMLAAAPPQEQKQMLGERLFPLIQRMYPDLAGKITGMLLEIDNAELLHMLEDHNSLKGKVSLGCVLTLVGPHILSFFSFCRSRRLWLCSRLTRVKTRRSKRSKCCPPEIYNLMFDVKANFIFSWDNGLPSHI